MFDVFYQNPMPWIALVFACIGAFGFILFTIGFFAGLSHLFTLSAHEGHMAHRRVRATWGVLIMIHAYIVWEVVRVVAGWFGGPPGNPGLVYTLLLIYFIVFVVLGIFFGITKKFVEGGGH